MGRLGKLRRAVAGPEYVPSDQAASGAEEAAAPAAEPPPEDAVDEQIEGLIPSLEQLSRDKLTHRYGVRRELKHAPELLAEGEEVLNLANGSYEDNQGLILVTDRRVIFFEKGMVRSHQEDFPYGKIGSIQTGTKMFGGHLTIYVSGNKAEIKRVIPKERVQEIGDYVRSRITEGAPAPAAAPAAAPDHGDRLRRAKGMLDDGLISAEEYEAKRQEILADL